MKAIFNILLFALLLTACSSLGIGGPCDQATFIDDVIVDVPVQQGTTVMPGVYFTKTWQVQNSGTCDWDGSYSLVHVSGDALGAPEEVALPAVAAGETVDISVEMVAPSQPGSYTSGWMLLNHDGETFGVGQEGDQTLKASLVVPTLPDGVTFDFTQMACLARWDSARATFLPCEGEDDETGDVDGYIRVNSDPALEGSSRNNPPVIEVKPNNQQDSWIEGTFPAVTINDGDHFKATVGCMDGNDGCKLRFLLQAQVGQAKPVTVLEWEETYDDVANEIAVDLSQFAGQEVALILRVEENGGRSLEAKGFWQDARIEHGLRSE